MRSLNVDLGERSYGIHIECGLMGKTADILNESFNFSGGMIVTDSNVSELYAGKIKNEIVSLDQNIKVCEFSAGESSKNIETLKMIYQKAVNFGLNRKSAIFALGGGVTGDLSGFAAATYMRGISYVQIPTTLLAMVDSSVGGKTAIDLPEGKNLVGAFWQPKLVIIDPEFLRTLSEIELRCGLAEVIKYGMIMDKGFFEELESNTDALKNLDLDFYSYIIAHCCKLKAEIVRQDEKEGGLRAILNYGHTFGHAIEMLSNFDSIKHGEGVAIGMSIAANLAEKMGILSNDEMKRQNELLYELHLPCFAHDTDAANIYNAMFKDKKTVGKKLTLILPGEIGKVDKYTDLKPELILSAIDEHC